MTPRWAAICGTVSAAFSLWILAGRLPAAAQTSSVETLRADTKMVVVAVVVSDTQGNLISNLTAADFSILDDGKPQRMASFRLVKIADSPDPSVVPLIGYFSACSRGWHAPLYYEVSYYPTIEAQHNGFHALSISVGQIGVEVLYRHGYYADLAAQGMQEPNTGRWKPDSQLAKAACSNIVPGRSLPVTARQLSPPGQVQPEFSADLTVGEISFTHAGKESHQLSLDFAACALDRAGTPLRYVEKKIHQDLPPEQMDYVRKNGFPYRLKFPLPSGVVSVRFAVRDADGIRIGTDELAYNPYAFDLSRNTRDQGSLRYFGRTSSAPESFCGEVYKYPPQVSDAPIGLLFSPFLNTPDQFQHQGLPGVMETIDLFSIDYFGIFWIDKQPGDYRFNVISDDGARIFIDNVEVINNDGIHSAFPAEGQIHLDSGEHHIRVKYYQGNPVRVALQLFIAPPKGKFQIMDLRDYTRPGFSRQVFANPIDEADRATEIPSELPNAVQPAAPVDYCEYLARNIAYPEALSNACKYAYFVMNALPNVICNQRTERYNAQIEKSEIRNTKLRDVVTAEVGYLHGHSTYSGIAINGKLAAESPAASGAWGEGEFGPILGMIFSPSNSPNFKFAGETIVDRTTALQYDFNIQKANNRSWSLHVPPSAYALGVNDPRSSLFPGIKGSLWLNKANGQIMRTDIEALDFGTFPLERVIVQIRYAETHLPDGSTAVLPVNTDSSSCYPEMRGCAHLVADFHGCHKFVVSSRILPPAEAIDSPK